MQVALGVSSGLGMASARASAAVGLAGKAAESMKLAGDDLGSITETGRIDTTTPRWSAIDGEDGEGWPPGWTVFKNPPRDYLYACIVCGILTLATVVGVVWQIRRQRKVRETSCVNLCRNAATRKRAAVD